MEQHINGDIMDSTETVIEFCKTMTWQQKNPRVTFVDKKYSKGKNLSAKDMDVVE